MGRQRAVERLLRGLAQEIGVADRFSASIQSPGGMQQYKEMA
jgi:hypothetical protein